MWMMPLHLHVNQESDYDDDDDGPMGLTMLTWFTACFIKDLSSSKSINV